MIAEVTAAVLAQFVARLSEEFIKKQRKTVDVNELQEQIAQIVVRQQALAVEAAEVRQAVIVLTRYLTVVQKDMFLIRDDQLWLAEGSKACRDADIESAITQFDSLAEQNIGRQQFRSQRTGDDSVGDSGAGPRRPRVFDPPDQASALEASTLDNFLEGFNEEVTAMRLAQREWQE